MGFSKPNLYMFICAEIKNCDCQSAAKISNIPEDAESFTAYVGFLLKDTQTTFIISNGWTETQQGKGIQVIPKRCVLNWRLLPAGEVEDGEHQSQRASV